jgi:hypothetical protein
MEALALVAKSTRLDTDHPKTDVVVQIVGRIVITIRRTAVIRIVVPRTTTQQPDVPIPFSVACALSWMKHKSAEYLLA